MKLIDADALDLKLQNERERLISLNMLGAENILVHCAMRHVLEAPTIDAVPVVRCKDCRWWDKTDNGFGYCHAEKHCHISAHWEISIFRTYRGDHFCADGEREDDE